MKMTCSWVQSLTGAELCGRTMEAKPWTGLSRVSSTTQIGFQRSFQPCAAFRRLSLGWMCVRQSWFMTTWKSVCRTTEGLWHFLTEYYWKWRKFSCALTVLRISARVMWPCHMTFCSFYPCGGWEASKTRVASPHLPQPSGEWTADLKVCVRHNSEALKLSEDKRRRNSPVSKTGSV